MDTTPPPYNNHHQDNDCLPLYMSLHTCVIRYNHIILGSMFITLAIVQMAQFASQTVPFTLSLASQIGLSVVTLSLLVARYLGVMRINHTAQEPVRYYDHLVTNLIYDTGCSATPFIILYLTLLILRVPMDAVGHAMHLIPPLCLLLSTIAPAKKLLSIRKRHHQQHTDTAYHQARHATTDNGQALFKDTGSPGYVLLQQNLRRRDEHQEEYARLYTQNCRHGQALKQKLTTLCLLLAAVFACLMIATSTTGIALSQTDIEVLMTPSLQPADIANYLFVTPWLIGAAVAGQALVRGLLLQSLPFMVLYPVSKPATPFTASDILHDITHTLLPARPWATLASITATIALLWLPTPGISASTMQVSPFMFNLTHLFLLLAMTTFAPLFARAALRLHCREIDDNDRAIQTTLHHINACNETIRELLNKGDSAAMRREPSQHNERPRITLATHNGVRLSPS